MSVRIIDGRPHIRPCAHIPPEGTEGTEWGPTPISSRYAAVNSLLPLAGDGMMGRSRRGGEPALAARLRAEAPWMDAAVDRIADQIAMSVWAGRPWVALRPMLLVGPPGAGKSHLARRLGELSGCGSAVLSFAGVNSSAEIAGNPRGFRHPQACFPVCVMQRVGTANPVVVVDEVEKTSVSDIGDPVSTLLSMLEPSTARRFYDGCLAAEVDLSAVNWVLTANSAHGLPAPLLSRVDVVEVRGPGPEHAEQVLANLWRDVARDLSLPPAALPRLEQAAELMLLRLFRRTRSVRRLRRAVEGLVAVSARHAPRALN